MEVLLVFLSDPFLSLEVPVAGKPMSLVLVALFFLNWAPARGANPEKVNLGRRNVLKCLAGVVGLLSGGIVSFRQELIKEYLPLNDYWADPENAHRGVEAFATTLVYAMKERSLIPPYTSHQWVPLIQGCSSEQWEEVKRLHQPLPFELKVLKISLEQKIREQVRINYLAHEKVTGRITIVLEVDDYKGIVSEFSYSSIRGSKIIGDLIYFESLTVPFDVQWRPFEYEVSSGLLVYIGLKG